MREWRKTHPMTEEQRIKDAARSYAGVYKRRGVLKIQPCHCGAPAEMHHTDYSKPLQVEWICRKHHLEHHRAEQNVSRETFGG
jgi:hypothetical protein